MRPRRQLSWSMPRGPAFVFGPYAVLSGQALLWIWVLARPIRVAEPRSTSV